MIIKEEDNTWKQKWVFRQEEIPLHVEMLSNNLQQDLLLEVQMSNLLLEEEYQHHHWEDLARIQLQEADFLPRKLVVLTQDKVQRRTQEDSHISLTHNKETTLQKRRDMSCPTFTVSMFNKQKLNRLKYLIRKQRCKRDTFKKLMRGRDKNS